MAASPRAYVIQIRFLGPGYLAVAPSKLAYSYSIQLHNQTKTVVQQGVGTLTFITDQIRKEVERWESTPAAPANPNPG